MRNMAVMCEGHRLSMQVQSYTQICSKYMTTVSNLRLGEMHVRSYDAARLL
jgi:hypothetical protein